MSGIMARAGLGRRGKAAQLAAVTAEEVEAGTPYAHEAIYTPHQTPIEAPGERIDNAPPGEPEKDFRVVISCDEPGKEDFNNLGELLVYLRLTYFERVSDGTRDRPRSDLKAAAVVEYLRRHNYSMTSGSYSLLEQGKTLPRNPEEFLAVISECLGVERTSKYWMLLRRQYIYDHTVRYVGKEYADRTILHGSRLLESLRREPSDTDPLQHAHPAGR